MTKLTQSVKETIREVAAHHEAGSPEMRRITTSVIREVLRDEHGIRIRTGDLVRIVAR